jgi:hypothetical protein
MFINKMAHLHLEAVQGPKRPQSMALLGLVDLAHPELIAKQLHGSPCQTFLATASDVRERNARECIALGQNKPSSWPFLMASLTVYLWMM